MRKKLLLILLVLPAFSFAQSVSDPAYANMQRSVGGIIQQSAVARGYSTTDPRTFSTLYGVGNSIRSQVSVAATGLGVAAAGVAVVGTAPAWATALGIAAAGLTIAVDVGHLINWAFGSDNNKPITNNTSTTQVPGGAYKTASGSCTVYENIADNCVGAGEPSRSFSSCMPTGENPTNSCLGGGQTTFDGAMTAAGLTQGLIVITQSHDNQSMVDAIATLNETQKSQKVAYDSMAKLINAFWLHASSQPGYSGIPFDSENPVTQSQVQTFAEANSASYPTVSSLVSPVSDSSTGFNPLPADSSTGTGTGTGTSTGTGTASNPLDWTIGSSTEAIPKQAVPISYTPTVFASPTGCPTPISFSMFGKSYAIAYQPACDLMSTLAPIFLAIGAAAAALIFAESLK